MTKFFSKLITEELIGGKYCKLYKDFQYFSDILKILVTIPKDFICDYESVPLIKASSKHGGVVHDYFCRKDSIPVVTKQMAASLYLEAQACRDSMLDKENNNLIFKLDRLVRRQIKTLVVRVVPGYFHKHYVLSPLGKLKNK